MRPANKGSSTLNHDQKMMQRMNLSRKHGRTVRHLMSEASGLFEGFWHNFKDVPNKVQMDLLEFRYERGENDYFEDSKITPGWLKILKTFTPPAMLF